VSVTVAGHVEGPTLPPFARLVQLRVGEAVHKMAVFGDRVWERSLLGGLAPSDPEPFDRLELSVGRAFGGGFAVPPGILQLPGLEHPHPGYRCEHHLNPRGVGMYPDERSASGAPLPNFERPGALLESWKDSPEPAAFSPCPELGGWRAKALTDRHFQDYEGDGSAFPDLPLPLALSWRLNHHAPPELIFDDVVVGTTIEIEGLSGGTVCVSTPGCLARLDVESWSKPGLVGEAPALLRALHIDTDRRLLIAVHGLAFKYDPRSAPKVLRVARAKGVYA
jgi:hypothetical protein